MLQDWAGLKIFTQSHLVNVRNNTDRSMLHGFLGVDQLQLNDVGYQ